LKEHISITSSNADVIKAIRAEITEATDRSVEILKGRLEAYGPDDFKVEKSSVPGQISIEVQGVDDIPRVKNLLLASANIEFRETYDYKDVYAFMEQADKQMSSMADTNKVSGTQKVNEPQQGNQSIGDYTKQHPLFAYLQPALSQDGKGNYYPAHGPAAGYCKVVDTAKVDSMLRYAEMHAIFPKDLRFAWTVKPADEKNNNLELIALKLSTRDGAAPLDGSVITDARQDVGQNGNNEISITMNAEGARIWKNMTANNVGKSIAIMVDGYVYSYPTVQDEIPGGKSSITGNFTLAEAKDLANVLKCGKLPARLQIIEETVTGGKNSGDKK
jgi:SecD/SecF fusion protein